MSEMPNIQILRRIVRIACTKQLWTHGAGKLAAKEEIYTAMLNYLKFHRDAFGFNLGEVLADMKSQQRFILYYQVKWVKLLKSFFVLTPQKEQNYDTNTHDNFMGKTT